MNSILLAFITGLSTGGISCFAVQGGLFTSILADKKNINEKVIIFIFLFFKFIGYTLLGGLLGLVGASIIISPKVQGYMQIFAGFVMLISVGKLLDIHPFFRRLNITPPKSVYRFLRSKKINENNFAPAILGFLTILIPCGVTQSMMILSVASGSVFYGSLILAAFILGTTPLFIILGVISNKFIQNKSLNYLAGLIIFILAVVSINTGQILRGSPHTIQNYYSVILGKTNNYSSSELNINNKGGQEITLNVTTHKYTASNNILKVNIPVELKLVTNNVSGCIRSFTIPEMNISKILPSTGIEVIEFTPTKIGRLVYTCSMGMYTGEFQVIN